MKKKPIAQEPSLIDMKKDTEALKQLGDLEELVNVPPERGGVYFSEWEKNFIRDVREQHNRFFEFSKSQRGKIKEIWHSADLRKRGAPDVKVENLFSKLPPDEQARQREAAARVKLPWE